MNYYINISLQDEKLKNKRKESEQPRKRKLEHPLQNETLSKRSSPNGSPINRINKSTNI